MYENSTGGTSGSSTGTTNGDAARTRAAEAKEHLRAAKDAAADAVRGGSAQARDWTRSQFSSLQERVEAEPYKATAWALGIGFVVGVLITALARSGSR
jgi:ElaB/YqjD/DUF883 family membrane-anchored ribosome-binding protein